MIIPVKVQRMRPLNALSLAFFLIAFYFAVSLFFPIHEVWIYESLFFLIPALFFLKFKPVLFDSKFFIKKTTLTELLLVATLAIGISFFLDLVLNYWNHLLPLPQSYQNYYEQILVAPHWRDEIYLYFSLGLFPAICEEYFFRGFLQNTLAKSWSNKTAIAVTAALFALCHLNPWYFPFYLILGYFLGWCQSYRNNILHPILAHLINNLIAITAFKVL